MAARLGALPKQAGDEEVSMKTRALLSIACLIFAAACGSDPNANAGAGGSGAAGGAGGTGGTGGRQPYCGDGVVNTGIEECDGDDLPRSCVDLRFASGSTSCTDDCRLDFSMCRYAEDCSSPGDEDEDGAADCDDADCAESFDCPVCGNGIVQQGEVCDGPGTVGSCVDHGFELGMATCSSTCSVDTSDCRNPTCGDGVREGSEACDDGNTDPLDGCSADCGIEAGDGCSDAVALDARWDEDAGRYVWSVDLTAFSADLTPPCSDVSGLPDAVGSFTAPSAGTWELSVSHATLWAWDGTCSSPDAPRACDPADGSRSQVVLDLQEQEIVFFAVASSVSHELDIWATPVLCGDGLVAGEEECDDGNTLDGDGCSATCELPGEDCLNPLAMDEHPIDWDETFWLWNSGGAQFADDFAGSCGGAAGADVVTSFTAPRDGRYHLGFGGAGANGGVMYVWQGACGAGATESVCVDVPNEHGVLIEIVELVAGEQIYVVVDGPSVGSDAPIDLAIIELVCGDGRLTHDEECDDGDTIDGDGCSASCRLEAAPDAPGVPG